MFLKIEMSIVNRMCSRGSGVGGWWLFCWKFRKNSRIFRYKKMRKHFKNMGWPWARQPSPPWTPHLYTLAMNKLWHVPLRRIQFWNYFTFYETKYALVGLAFHPSLKKYFRNQHKQGRDSLALLQKCKFFKNLIL